MQCRRGYYFFGMGANISALEHVRMLKVSIYVLLACINTICKYGHACEIERDIY